MFDVANIPQVAKSKDGKNGSHCYVQRKRERERETQKMCMFQFTIYINS